MRAYRLVDADCHTLEPPHLWETWLPKFKKVMPVEYREALKQMERAQASDTTGLEILEIGLPRVKQEGASR